MNAQQLTSILGIAVILGLAGLLSRNRKAINWKTMAWGCGLQILFALVMLKTAFGVRFFKVASDVATGLLNFQTEGAKFVFGGLGIPAGQTGSLGFFFAFQVLTTIIFLAALVSLLYYLGIMQKVVIVFAKVMAWTCKTAGAETLSVSASTFVGQTEAPLMVRPYVEKMTESELFCIMTSGMAHISCGLAVTYAMMLSPFTPNAAGHLMAACLMAGPATLIIAKLIIPETGRPETMGIFKMEKDTSASNAIEAAANGTTTGLQLALNVGAMLVSFMALLAMCNWGVHYVSGWLGRPDVGLEQIFGWILYPIAWLIGTPLQDCATVGQLIGMKTVLNEFVGYANMTTMMTANASVMSPRAALLALYALSGFANILSIAIQIGGLSVMAPSRRSDLARLGPWALLAGSLASFLTAAIVGLMIP